MTGTLLGKKCMASIAVFGELAKKNMDVYDALAEFIRYCIFSKKLHSFSLYDIKQMLNSEYDFTIPDPVVKNGLKRIKEIILVEKMYFVQSALTISIDIYDKKTSLEKNQEMIIREIECYIENKLMRKLYTNEKELVYNHLFEYLIQNSIKQDLFGKLIVSFVLENRTNTAIVECLNIIKEGVLLYSAFQYTPEEYSNNLWTTELVLYFDTEHLFSIFGLNGNLYKQNVDDLLELIKTINQVSFKKTGRNIILLRFFKEIQQEIDYYFNSATAIISKNKDTLGEKPAMLAILNGCSDISDVIEKKALFFGKLTYLEFECDEEEYFTEAGYKYHLVDRNEIEEIKLKYSSHNEKDIETNIEYLNKINILRQGRSGSLNQAKYFFITATSVCLNIAKHNHILREGAVPLASTIEYFIEKMWIKTNRNFAKINIKSISMVTNAQLVLKSVLDISINEKYSETKKKYSEKKISIQEANSVFAEMRNFRKANSDVSDSNIDDILSFTNASIDSFVDNYNYELAKSKEIQEENTKLKNENKEKDERLRYFEDQEEKKRIATNTIFHVLKTILILVISVGVILFNYFLNINRENKVINIALYTLGTIGTMLGVLRFFGIDFKLIKEQCFKKKSKRKDE